MGIAGLGLIGASIGLGLRASQACSVIGFEPDSSNADLAFSRGCVDKLVDSVADLAECSMIIICAPPSAIPGIIAELAPLIGPNTVITETASTKGGVVAAIPASIAERFVIAHPMAGHDSGGPGNSTGEMFNGAKWLICPTPGVSPGSLDRVRSLALSLGARPLEMPIAEHDTHVGILSHLPHIYASLLILESGKLTQPEAAGSSWGEMTRVGGAHPPLWGDILAENGEVLAELLGAAKERIEVLEEALKNKDAKPIEYLFEEARRVRDEKR